MSEHVATLVIDGDGYAVKIGGLLLPITRAQANTIADSGYVPPQKTVSIPVSKPGELIGGVFQLDGSIAFPQYASSTNEEREECEAEEHEQAMVDRANAHVDLKRAGKLIAGVFELDGSIAFPQYAPSMSEENDDKS